MADTFYPYSRQEAKREGELDRWQESHLSNVKCARDMDEQYLPDWAQERLAELRSPEQEQTDAPSQGGMEMG